MLEPAALAGSGLVLSRCIVQRTMSTHYTVHILEREKRERVVLYFRGYIYVLVYSMLPEKFVST